MGSRYRDILERLEIRSIEDLLRHYPFRWVDRRDITPLAALRPGLAAPVAGADGIPRRPVLTCLGHVVDREPRPSPRRPLRVTLGDDTGTIGLVFFGSYWRESHFPPGAILLVSGTLSVYHHALEFHNPECEWLSDAEEAGLHTGRLFPVYPLTRDLHQKLLRRWVRRALDQYAQAVADPLPPDLRVRYKLQDLAPALAAIHFPESEEARAGARRRLAFEEIFLDQLFMQAVRKRRELGKVGTAMQAGGSLQRRIRAALPFTLTTDQEQALGEILEDLSLTRPMNRLLQGDVGSGKTVVALLAAAAAADSGVQTAFMVPTEILAEQHVRTLGDLGGGLGLEPRLLTGSMSARARREVLTALASGTAPLVVGTHALFQDEVRFRDLGLVIVDEQHRFGVMQRVALLEKGRAPHVLVMSATPIPRSLALIRYADLDLSVIRHRPQGRGRVVTRVIGESQRDPTYAFTAGELDAGRQAFVIYPLVEESDRSELKAATTMARHLAARPEFQRHPVGLLHGQMPAEEKDATMTRFVRGEIHLLVATTVVEVGIDVPNASVLIIEHPERYGLSQLHQLRGRIGRGRHSSVCVLIRGEMLEEEAAQRLDLFARTDDGFALAELDLSLRGQGDLTGTRQHGRPAYKLVDPWRDVRMIEVARSEAKAILDRELEAGSEGWEPLRRVLRCRLEESGALVEAG